MFEVANETSPAGNWICDLPADLRDGWVETETEEPNCRRTIPRAATLIADHPESSSAAKFIAFTESAIGDKG